MSAADYICKQFGSNSGQTKCRLLIIFANNFDPDQARQNVICLSHLQAVWTQTSLLLITLANSLDTDQARQNVVC